MKWISKHLQQFCCTPAFISNDETCTYKELVNGIDDWYSEFKRIGIEPGTTVAIVGEFCVDIASLLFALMLNENIILPLTHETKAQHPHFFELSDTTRSFECLEDQGKLHFLPSHSVNPKIQLLRKEKEPGIVLFTSGTTGESKGAVLKASTLLSKYKNLSADRYRSLKTMIFLKLDHIGGLNTLFATLFNGGTAIPQKDRSVKAVCEAVDKHRVELLPTTPTFLNMLLFSDFHKEYDLSTLKVITYGTEPMPESTLRAANKAFPGVKFKQTYGSTELGIFSTKSKSSCSTWLKIGGDVQISIRENNTLWIRSNDAMLGYLNSDYPFDDEGWYNTDDQVEVNGDYMRILGRESEIINVAGEKVYPSEVENILLELENVKEALVQGKRNPVTGQIVTAVLDLYMPESRHDLQKRIHAHCRGRIQDFKIPKLINISKKSLVGGRLKKTRNYSLV